MNNRALLIVIFITSALLMTTYEVLKMSFFPNISLWQSHITTICLTSVIATTCANFVIKHIENLHRKASEDKLNMFQATMRKSMDIVGNFLNSMLYFKEIIESLPKDEQKLYDEIVHDTGDKLKEMGKLENDIQREIDKYAK